MDNFLKLASTRRSIRKFLDKDIPEEDIMYFINAAVSAPSGCNSQCWKFVAVRSRYLIQRIEEIVIMKTEEILEAEKGILTDDYLSSKRKMIGFFSNAPLVIAVFMTDTKFYDQLEISALQKKGYDKDSIMDLFANYDILSIGAAVQNLLLAVHEKGYGACWMNEPAVAGIEINKLLGIPPDEKFMSLIPIGLPAYSPREKKLKDIQEVFKIL